MTADTPTVTVDALDAAIAAATGQLSEDEQDLAVAVYRLLAGGAPASIPAAAAAAGITESAAGQVLRSWPAVFWDDRDRVTGFWGLAQAKMPPHRICHAGTDLSAWCAWDPLFLALVTGDLRVTTADPVTGEAVTYDIGHDGAITGASHPGSVLSFLRPDAPLGRRADYVLPLRAAFHRPGHGGGLDRRAPRHVRDQRDRRRRAGAPPRRPVLRHRDVTRAEHGKNARGPAACGCCLRPPPAS